MVGWHDEVGWYDDGKAVVMVILPSVCWCPPSVCVVAVLNGGVACCCGVPYLCVIPVIFMVFPLCCSVLPCAVLFSLLLCVVGGGVWWRVLLCCGCIPLLSSPVFVFTVTSLLV